MLLAALRRVWLFIVGCVLTVIAAWGYVAAANANAIPAVLPLDLILRKPVNKLLCDSSEQINNTYQNGGPRTERRVYVSADLKAGTVIQPDMVEVGEYQGPPSCPCPSSIDEVVGHRLKFDVHIGQHLYKYFVD